MPDRAVWYEYGLVGNHRVNAPPPAPCNYGVIQEAKGDGKG